MHRISESTSLAPTYIKEAKTQLVVWPMKSTVSWRARKNQKFIVAGDMNDRMNPTFLRASHKVHFMIKQSLDQYRLESSHLLLESRIEVMSSVA